MFLDNEWVKLLGATVLRDSQAFLPELILCGGIILMLLMRLFRGMDHFHLGWEAFTITVLALAVGVNQWLHPQWIQPDTWTQKIYIFGGMLVYDHFMIYLRVFLLAFTALIIWLSMLTGIPDREDSADFYCLLLGATIGMMLMVSANHLLMVFIGVEMASLPSYALAGFLKGKRLSSEASLKYVVYGGGASGIMLYGISLIAGKYGTGYLPDLAQLIPVTAVTAGRLNPVLVLGLLLIFIGLAFKLAAVPFHFWCPDVFEGAAAEVAAFLSVASKGAALGLLGRLVLVLVGNVSVQEGVTLNHMLVPTLGFFAALTATFGNLAAYLQTNLKRLLAYSTIAHAGYMLMGLATLSSEGAGAVLFYLIAYLFMNLGAFAIVAFLRNQTGSEDLSSFRGLVYRSPVLVVTLAIFLLSLLGLPPLVGFAAKFQIFQVLYKTGNEFLDQKQTTLAYWMFGLLIVGGINTVFSLFYYIKVLKVMILDRPEGMAADQELPPLEPSAGTAFYAALLAGVIFLAGILWNPLAEASDWGVSGFSKRLPPGATTAEVRQW